MGWSYNLIHVLTSSLLIGCNAQSNTLGLSSGLSSFSTSSFKLTLVNASQTLYSLRPSSGAPASFDYIPYDKMTQRQSNGQYHLGDITFRVRSVGSTSWVSGDSAKARKAVTVLTPDASKGELAVADLTPTLPGGTGISVKRKWKNVNGTAQLTFEITNTGKTSLEIGSLGAPLEFNNIFTDRTAADTNANCSVFDPYIGTDAGYVQVTPLLGTLPPLVVTPLSGTHSPLEGWRFLPEDTSQPPYYQSQTFEGLYEWMFHTSAYATNEWASVPGGPWNAPTSATLAAGETRIYGLEFRTAPSIPEIDTALANAKRPVSVGVPGYIVPNDAPAKLYLKYGSVVQNISVSPAGAISWTKDTSPSTGWASYTITPSSSAWGRARLTIVYADGLTQTVHYYLTAPGPTALANLGNFLTTKQWLNDSSDPFGRSPSVISYDREVNVQVKDEARAWIAGLSDEAGAGSWLAAMVKSYAQPSAAEITKLEAFVNKTLFKTLQNPDGTVKKSVYYYDKTALPNYKYPSSIDWGNWWSWNKASAYATDRAYDYVHVVGAYWSMYRVARNYPGLTQTTWNWYLSQAVLTIRAMTSGSVGYVEDGLMDESVILNVLLDLKREGSAWASMASDVESRMKSRAQAWGKTRYPFGSEMAWDSTGQEGVWQWANYFGDTTTAQNTVNSVIGYQPTIPHWGYNGNARRYWDNVYGGKLQRIERQIHHYGSGLNALPLLGAYRNVVNSTSTITASTFHLLRAGYGGASGALSNIDQSGFASASFHSFADTLKWDAYSGDYGPNLVGHVLGTGTYILQHAELGWLAFGGVVQSNNATGAVVDVRDSVRRRVNVAGVGTFGMDAGVFERVELNGKTLILTVLDRPAAVSGATAAPKGRLVVEGRGAVQGGLAKDAGAWVVPFVGGRATVTLAI